MTGRNEGDTWDLGSGVGATATAVATSRALATRAGIIDDRWAEPLVRAVANEHFTDMLDRPEAKPEGHGMARAMAVRTRYFDEFLLEAVASGIRQVVILASGLDSRAYRLPWPGATVVFDVDQPGVIEFKAAALRQLGARPTTQVRNVGIDLRDDWPAALQDSGFDAAQPTAWIAEGLLVYLPPDAQDRLFDHITALSRSGSRLATEFMPSMEAFTEDDDDDGEKRWKQMGFKDNLAGLVYTGERSHVIEYLEKLHWAVTGERVRDLFDAYSIKRPEQTSDAFENYQYISAVLG